MLICSTGLLPCGAEDNIVDDGTTTADAAAWCGETTFPFGSTASHQVHVFHSNITSSALDLYVAHVPACSHSPLLQGEGSEWGTFITRATLFICMLAKGLNLGLEDQSKVTCHPG